MTVCQYWTQSRDTLKTVKSLAELLECDFRVTPREQGAIIAVLAEDRALEKLLQCTKRLANYAVSS